MKRGFDPCPRHRVHARPPAARRISMTRRIWVGGDRDEQRRARGEGTPEGALARLCCLAQRGQSA